MLEFDFRSLLENLDGRAESKSEQQVIDLEFDGRLQKYSVKYILIPVDAKLESARRRFLHR